MNQDKRVEGKVFLAELALPVQQLMMNFAVASAEQVAVMLHFEKKENYSLQLAVEESFSNAVAHFTGEVTPSERIFIEYFIEDGSLIVSIREKGIPFDLKQSKKITPQSEDMDKPGLGLKLMGQAMDSVELFIHSHEGKEIRLTKKVDYDLLPPELVVKKKRVRVKRRNAKNIVTRLADENDALELSRLAWRCYGFAHKESLFDTEKLSKAIKEKDFISVLAINAEDKKIVGHCGLIYRGGMLPVVQGDTSRAIPEAALLFVDPQVRCPTFSAETMPATDKYSRENGDYGMYTGTLTSHLQAQRSSMDHVPLRPCCFLIGIGAIGWVPKGMGCKYQEKNSLISLYMSYDKTSRDVFIPKKHIEMVEKIYKNQGLPRNFLFPSSSEITGISKVDLVFLPENYYAAQIVVEQIGIDTPKEIAEIMNQEDVKRLSCMYVFIPVCDQHSPAIIEECEKLGFSFAGLIPHFNKGNDAIMMNLINIKLTYENIRTYGPDATELLQYVIADRKRVRREVEA